MSVILFVTPNETAGGAERHMVALAKQLQESVDCQIHVAVLLPEPLRREVPMGGVTFHYIGNFSDTLTSGVRALAAFPALLKLQRRLKPDYIYSCLEWSNLLVGAVQLAGAKSCWVAGLQNPIISRGYQRRGPISLLRQKLHDATVRRAERVVVPSAGLLADLAELGVEPKRCRVIGNVVPEVVRRSAGRAEGSLKLGFCGRLVEQKNPFAVLRVFERLSFLLPVELHIVGGGVLEPPLRRYCQERGISDKVVFHGFLSDPWSVLGDADVLLCTSRYEGFGNVMLEALGHGVAVVAYDAPYGAREILGDSAGVLVAYGDELAIEQELYSLLQSETRREELVHCGLQRAAQLGAAIQAQRFWAEAFVGE